MLRAVLPSPISPGTSIVQAGLTLRATPQAQRCLTLQRRSGPLVEGCGLFTLFLAPGFRRPAGSATTAGLKCSSACHVFLLFATRGCWTEAAATSGSALLPRGGSARHPCFPMTAQRRPASSRTRRGTDPLRGRSPASIEAPVTQTAGASPDRGPSRRMNVRSCIHAQQPDA